MAQGRDAGFGQKPHVQKADCKLATKGAANAAIDQLPGPLEVSGAVPETTVIAVAAGAIDPNRCTSHAFARE
jgi:hypothetical protein